MNKHEPYDACLTKIEHLMKDCKIEYCDEIEFLQYCLDRTQCLHEWTHDFIERREVARKKLKERLSLQHDY